MSPVKGWTVNHLRALLTVSLVSLTPGCPSPTPPQTSKPKRPAEVDPQIAEIDRVGRALDRTVKLEFDNVPLRDAARQIEKLAKIPVRLDEASLATGAISPETPVTFRINHVSLRNALLHMLRPEGLRFTVVDGAIEIYYPVSCVGDGPPRVYPVVDLTHCTAAPENADFDTLMELLVAHVSPDQWPDGTGPGPFEVFSGSLLVNADDSLHADLLAMLKAIRTANSRKSIRPVFVEPHNERLWHLLSQPSQLTFESMKTAAALQLLSDTFRAGFLVDVRSLDAAMVAVPTQLSLGRSESLAAALERMLLPHAMSFRVRQEAVVFGADDWETPHSIIWPVPDLAATSDQGTSLQASVFALIQRTLPNQMVVDFAMLPSKPLLFVTGTWTQQRRVAALLRQLRLGRIEEKRQRKRLESVDKWTTQIYFLTTSSEPDTRPMKAKNVARVLRKLFPELAVEGAALEPLEGRIVIRNLESVQAKVGRFLRRLESDWPRHIPGFVSPPQ